MSPKCPQPGEQKRPTGTFFYQGFLDAAFAPLIALDYDRLERLTPKFWHIQLHFTRFGVQQTPIAAHSRVLTLLAASSLQSRSASASSIAFKASSSVPRTFSSQMIFDPGLSNPDQISHLFAFIFITHVGLPLATIQGAV